MLFGIHYDCLKICDDLQSFTKEPPAKHLSTECHKTKNVPAKKT